MNKRQFTIIASKMQSSDLRDAAYLVLVKNERQCDVAKLYGLTKQNLNKSLKRLKAREAEFVAMWEMM